MRRNLLGLVVLAIPFMVGANSAHSQTLATPDNTPSVTMRATYYLGADQGKRTLFSDPTEATHESILSDLADPPSAPPTTPTAPARPEAIPAPPAPPGGAYQPTPAEGSQRSPSDGSNGATSSAPSAQNGNGNGNCQNCNANGCSLNNGCGNGSCDNGCCDSGCCDCDCCDEWPGCDDCPSSSLMLFAGVESWRGISESDWQNNNGASFGANYGAGFGILREYGVGFQLGGSYGVYDWNGRGSAQNEIGAQQQVFMTTGFFIKPDCESYWSAGFVYDWMINTNFGAPASDGTLGQWRGQLGYALSTRNEVGAWFAARDRSMHQDGLSYRGVDQLNFFWHHKFCEGADMNLWTGFPDHTQLDGTGSLGDWIIGGTFNVPISDRWALYANGQYMHPSSRPGDLGASEATWNIGFGLAFYLNGNARTRTVAGSCWAPLMNVANNGTFMVDSNLLNN